MPTTTGRGGAADGPLDCLVIGYNDSSFQEYESRVMSAPASSPERRMFMREHLRVDGRRMPYMDVVNHFLAAGSGADDRTRDGYLHVAEMPNLAAAYLASFLLKRQLSADFVSLFSAERSRVAEISARRRPRVVAITTTFYLVPWPVVEIVRFVREHAGDALIVVGGPLVDNLVNDLDEESLADAFALMDADVYVHEGQGERTLSQLVRAVRDDQPLESVPNLYLPHTDGYRRTGSQPENNPLDDCVIDWSLFPDEQLGRTVQTRTARSCAYKCAFCDYPVRAGALTLATVEAVEAELRQLDRRGTRNVVFIDDTFNVPGPRFKELCRMMIRNRFEFEWFSYFRAAAARDEETFDLMRDSGCRAVFLGVESGSDTVLAGMSKVATARHYRTGIERLHQRGITKFASFIVGFPGETDGTVRETIDFLNETAPTFFRAEPWWYNRRSPIHRQAGRYDLTGQGYQWKHSTMDVHGACDALDAVFAQVTESVWMPAHNFDFWALPYLLGKGLTLDQVVGFHRQAQRLMADNEAAVPGAEAGRAYEELGRLFAGVSIEAPRYRTDALANR